MTTIIGAYPDVADAITTLTGGPTDRLVAVLPHAAATDRPRTLLREARIECITTLAEAGRAGAEWLAQELAASQGWRMDDGGPAQDHPRGLYVEIEDGPGGGDADAPRGQVHQHGPAQRDQHGRHQPDGAGVHRIQEPGGHG